MNILDSYSQNFEMARQRFRDAASNVNARLERHAVSVDGYDDGTLTIDVAFVGSPDPRWTVVVSSGLHGVEGFFGSAIQVAWLTDVATSGFQPEHGRIVLVHAINPYGFMLQRRTNEDNADLNRNFLFSSESYRGAPDGYADLDAFLNPTSPPSRLEPYRLKALWNIWRLGLPAIKNAVAGGQYDYPKGIFFGGHGPAQSSRIIQDNFDQWIGSASDVVHVDFHSGLGKYSHYKLLLVEPMNSPNLEWYRDHFGAESVEPVANGEGTAYEASGIIGDWIARHFKERNYRFLAAEFGTYSVIRVLGALRAENRAHFYCEPNSRVYQRTKNELLECFCPASDSWRKRVLEQGVQTIEQCIRSVES
jgi:hypothetical protein